MPNIKSAEKRVKVIAVKTARNKAKKTELKTQLKKSAAAIVAGENKEEAVAAAYKKIDQAVAKGLLTKNTAARKKSAIARKANA